MAITVHVSEKQGVTVTEVGGRITLGPETNQLRDTIKGQLQAGRTRLVLNLGKVEYIDSSGLGTLVGLYTTAAGMGAKIKLTQVTGRFHELLVLTKLLTVFEIYDSEAAAVASFGASVPA